MTKLNLDYILIPMAGLGKRFKKEKFKTLKPLISIDNETILEKSIKNLPDAKKKIVVLNQNIYKKNLLAKKIFFEKNFEPFLLKNFTKGQADTIYKLKENINHQSNALIHSCDYIFRYSEYKFYKKMQNFDVIVFVYRLKSRIIKNYNNFAYCKVKMNNVLKIVEKRTISNKPWKDLMVIGTFWFKKMNFFFKSQEISLKKKQTISGEYFIANNINNLIKSNLSVGFFEVDEWINLGDFFDYNQYIYWKNFFLKNKNFL